MASVRSLRPLNSIKYTQQWVQEGLSFLVKGFVPSRYFYRLEQERFASRYNRFTTNGTELHFEKYTVVPKNSVTKVLEKVYSKLGDLGRNRLYGYIKRKYLGISRRAVMKFLTNQEVHQLAMPVRRLKVKSPIIATKPMERWQIDLIEYKSSHNHGTTFYLTVIDCFSKFAWVVPLTSKHSRKIAAALKQIFKEVGKPQIVQSDNGTEFKDEVDALLQELNIQHIMSSAYSPQSNAQIERFNGTIKRAIHAHMNKTQMRIYVPALPNLVKAYNRVPHGTTGYAPIDLHAEPGLQQKALERIEAKAAKSILKLRYPPKMLHIGDYVRVATKKPI